MWWDCTGLGRLEALLKEILAGRNCRTKVVDPWSQFLNCYVDSTGGSVLCCSVWKLLAKVGMQVGAAAL